MTRLIRHASGIVGAAVMVIGSASAAQADETVVAKVPFTFIVGDTRLPAGDYVVTELADGSGVLQIRSADARQFAVTVTIPAGADNTPSQPELVFEKFNHQYF